ncbi:MAG: hypothetical protein R3C19_02790 [Planctomycetaceae bacterium]
MSYTNSNSLSGSDNVDIAMQRVPKAVIERARATSTPVVVWIDGKIAHLTPDEAEKMIAEQDRQRSG